MPRTKQRPKSSHRSTPSRGARRSAISAATTSARRAITPEDLLRFEFLSDPQVSPDGVTVVFAKKNVGEKNSYNTNLWMVSAANGDTAPRQFTNGGKDSHPRWSPAGDRIAFIGAREKGKPQIYIMNPAGGEALPLTRFSEGTIASFTWSPDGRWIAAIFRETDPDWSDEARKARQEAGLSDPPRVLDDWWYRLDGDGYFNAQRHHLYVVDVGTGGHRLLFDRSTMGISSLDFSPDSKSLVISANLDPKAMIRPWMDQLFRIDIASGAATAIPNMPLGPKEQVRWSPDGKRIAYAGKLGENGSYGVENVELFVCDAVNGRPVSLTAREDYCLMAATLSDTADAAFTPFILWSPDSRRIFTRIGWRGEGHIASVAADGGAVTFHSRGALEHVPGNLSRDGRVMALLVGSAMKLPEIHAGRLNGKGILETKSLTDANGPLLSELELATPRADWVRAADGTRVQVWSLRPAGASTGRKVPAILAVHGGPHAQYGVPFFHEFQVHVAQGYAVFFSNPRGSKGYGEAHTAAIKGSWGGADWTDIRAVIGFMKKQAWVDAKRLGIMGGSYGGYMTNWAIGHTHDFKAAITDRCVSNLVSMFGTSDYAEAPGFYWPGNSWDQPEAMWKSSPLRYFGSVRTPTLIIHSEGDLRCNIEQAEQVFTALKLLDVPARLVRYPPCCSHGMSRGGPPDLRLHRLHQMLDWWREYLAG